MVIISKLKKIQCGKISLFPNSNKNEYKFINNSQSINYMKINQLLRMKKTDVK